MRDHEKPIAMSGPSPEIQKKPIDRNQRISAEQKLKKTVANHLPQILWKAGLPKLLCILCMTLAEKDSSQM